MIKVYKIFLLILVLILLSTFNPNKFEISYKTKDNFFKIEKIIILNNSLVKKDIILKRLDQLYGKNIFLIKRKKKLGIGSAHKVGISWAFKKNINF